MTGYIQFDIIFRQGIFWKNLTLGVVKVFLTVLRNLGTLEINQSGTT